MTTTTLPPTTQPATRTIVRVDSPSAAYAEIVARCPEARVLVDRLLGNIASRVANTAQILALNAAEWKPLAEENGDQDEATMHLLEGRSEALAWVHDELGVLVGSGLGRAAQIPAFANPVVWCCQVPPDASDICGSCNGSGEGMYDGTRCSSCRGSGSCDEKEAREVDVDYLIDRDRDDRAERRNGGGQ